jgi:predicted HNH restriction endonuclease
MIGASGGSANASIIPTDRRGELPNESQLEYDLTRLLLLYQALIEARDQVQADEGDAADPTGVPRRGIEAKRYRWHRRAERSPSLARGAKRIHGTRCQVAACRKELVNLYGTVAGITSKRTT